MMRSFLDLPEELAHSVLGLVGQDDLRNLTLVSRRARALAEIRFYRQIGMYWGISRSFLLLIRAMLERPALGPLIRVLSLTGGEFEHLTYMTGPLPSIYDEYPEAFGIIDADMASERIHATRVPHAEAWVEGVKKGNMDAVFTLMLSLTPNLTQLDIGPDFTRENKILGATLKHILCRELSDSGAGASAASDAVSNMFQRLHFVRFNVEVRGHLEEDPELQQIVYKDVRNTMNVLPFFYIPNARTLELCIDNPSQFVWPVQAPPVASSLENLDLYTLREASLFPILAATPNLKSFSWRCSYTAGVTPDASKPIIQLDQLAAALRHVQGTLQNLVLEADCSGGYYEEEVPDLAIEGSLLGLADLEQVTTLSAPWYFLMGMKHPCAWRLADVLPRKVETVQITNDLRFEESDDWNEFDMFYALKDWLEAWQTRTPRLRSVVFIPSRSSNREWGVQMRRELKLLCDRVGIDLKIIKHRWHRDWKEPLHVPEDWVWSPWTRETHERIR